MPLKISGKNVDIGQALRSRIDQTIADAVQKYFDGGYSGHVTVMRNGRIFRTECSVHLDSGMVFEATGNDDDANASFDQAAERLQKRLRRYKRRLKDRSRVQSAKMITPAATFVLTPPPEDDELADRHGTRYDRCAGRRFPQFQSWRHQCRLPASGRPFRLDRSSPSGRRGYGYKGLTAANPG
jgi:ribosomal subunit interface protein